MQDRTDEDIKSSNDGILKTVDEFCKDEAVDKMWEKLPPKLKAIYDNLHKEAGEDCFIYVPDLSTREECSKWLSKDEQVDKCKCGKEVTAVFDLCPYSSEIHGSTDKCNCCEDCRHECCMDI